jgi:hypothetical protein
VTGTSSTIFGRHAAAPTFSRGSPPYVGPRRQSTSPREDLAVRAGRAGRSSGAGGPHEAASTGSPPVFVRSSGNACECSSANILLLICVVLVVIVQAHLCCSCLLLLLLFARDCLLLCGVVADGASLQP